eukprot:3226531-Amphidinium_carterae.1
MGHLDHHMDAMVQAKVEKAHAETMARAQALEQQVNQNAQSAAAQIQQLATNVDSRTQKLESDVGTIVHSLTSMAAENRRQFAAINTAFDAKLDAFSELMLSQLSKEKKREREGDNGDPMHTGAGFHDVLCLVYRSRRSIGEVSHASVLYYQSADCHGDRCTSCDPVLDW